jgi:uncharacterized protein (DUF2267 family)
MARKAARAGVLEVVGRELHGHLDLRDTERVARIVLRIITQNLTPGEIRKIVDALPRDLRALWPESSASAAR